MRDYRTAEERAALSREIAREGIVLLKNEDNMLPLASERVAVFGRTQVDTVKCGTGSAFCESEYVVDILTGMENAGINVDKELASRYRAWCERNKIASFSVWGSGAHLNPEMPISREDIADASRRADKAVYIIGRTAGENDDSNPIEGDYMLSSEEKKLVADICEAFDKVLIIVNSGNTIDLSFTENEKIKAVVLLNLPGMEGGNALGDILSGKFSPSGKLTDTYARSVDDYPSTGYFGKKTGVVQNYYEDIFVGYRYFETFPKMSEKVLYPFGFGLSYTEFKMSCESFVCENGKINAKIKVTNIGAAAGKEVAMLYSSAPENALGAPKYELRAFAKTRTLAPGESEVLTLTFDINDLASFDDTGVLGVKDAWVIPAGAHEIYMGNSVASLTKIGEYEGAENTVVKRCVHLDTTLARRLTASGEYETLEVPPVDIVEHGIEVDPEKTVIAPEDFAHSDEESTVYRIAVTTPGLYNMHICSESGSAFPFTVDEREFENYADFYREQGAEVILPLKKIDIVFKKSGDTVPKATIMLVKNDAPIVVTANGVSMIEGGKYIDYALYVVNRPFKDTLDDGFVIYGNALSRMHSPGRFAMYRLEVEKAGYYDVRLRYATPHGDRLLSDTFSFLVSNVTQDIEHVMLHKTNEDADEMFRFRTSEPIRLALPKGEAYLKIISCARETPLVAYLELTPSTREVHHIAEKRTGGDTAVATDGEVIARRPLAPITREYDFRNVLAGRLSMDDFINDLSDEELATLTCGNTNTHFGYLPDRGIPEVYWSDGPVGFRQEYKVTVYPSATMVSASWNEALAHEFGVAAGTEAKLYNVDIWLAPGMNIHRHPCCGRNFEYHSEDPYLTGKIVGAIVRGTEEQGVATTIKHFAANNTEYERSRSDSRVSARALREIYFRAFERVIKENDPMSLMTSYNLINGVRPSESYTMCREIIRDEFGFTGMFMSDFANSAEHVKELSALHDLKMHFGDIPAVMAAMSDGTLPREKVKHCVKKILELVEKTSAKYI